MADKKYEENEDTEMWRKIREDRQERHQQWKKNNMDKLIKSGLSFVLASQECVIFRDPRYPSVDFYPSTGRWRNIKSGRTYSGGAESFISWYKNNPLTID